MFYHTLSLINKDHLINLCTQKLSLSFQVTSVWTPPIYFQFLLSSRHCCVPQLRCVTTNIWEKSRSWVGVGRSCKHPHDNFAPTQPLSDSLSPSVPSSPQSPYTLRISWTYIEAVWHNLYLFISFIYVFYRLTFSVLSIAFLLY